MQGELLSSPVPEWSKAGRMQSAGAEGSSAVATGDPRARARDARSPGANPTGREEKSKERGGRARGESGSEPRRAETRGASESKEGSRRVENGKVLRCEFC